MTHRQIDRPFPRAAFRSASGQAMTALVADYVVLGGGHATKLTQLPEGARLGDNAHALIGGQRLWKETR